MLKPVQPVWGVYGIRTNAHAWCGNQEAVDDIARAVQSRVGMAEVRFVPSLEVRLIRHFDLDAEIAQHCIDMHMRCVFALFAEIVFIEVTNRSP